MERGACGEAIVRPVINPPESRYEVVVEMSSHRCKKLMIGITWDEWSSNWDEQLVSGTNGQ